MKTLLILGFCLIPFFIKAQNVGIGTSSPSYKLQVHNPDGANNYMNITNTTSGSTAADGLFMGLTGTSAILGNLENGSLSLGTNNLTRVLITAGGDVGIGTSTPTAKLDINGNVKLEGLNLFEFGAGIAGKELNAGKIGYNGFGTTALAIVGAGTNASNRAVYFFAEGGTTFSGPAGISGHLNLGGQLQFNGSPGAAGQVLTSNGAADPSWQDASYTNNTRFSVKFYTNTAGAGFMDLTNTEYNLTPADITVGATSVTINRAGLYRLNGTISGWVSYPTTTPAWLPELDCGINLTGTMSDGFSIANYEHYHKRSSVGNPNYYISKQFTMDIHLLTGTIISVPKSLHWDGSPSFFGSASLALWGNLIAE